MAKSNSKKPTPKGSKAALVRPAALKAKGGKATKLVAPKQKAKPAPAAKKGQPQKLVKPVAKVAAKAVSKSSGKPASKSVTAVKSSVKSKSMASKPASLPSVKNGKKSPEKTAVKSTKAAVSATKKTLPAESKEASKTRPTPAAPVTSTFKPTPVAPRKGSHSVIPEDAPVIKKPAKPLFPASWVESQRERILELRDSILEAMHGVAQDTLRSRAEGSEASAFGMHQADAGSDAYDRDFALSLLSQEQDALYEIEEALKRIQLGTYGICEISGKAILVARLEALPFARYTVECQEEVERQGKMHRARLPVTSLFGLTDEEGQESEEEEAPSDNKE
jgi:DnaK suppressor protein